MNDATRRIWPWLVGLAVVAVAVWLVISAGERQGPPEPEIPATRSIGEAESGGVTPDTSPVTAAAAGEIHARTEEMRAAVRRYEGECSTGLEVATGEGVGEVVADCVERLSAAVDAIVAGDTVGQVAIEERLALFREQARRLGRMEPGEGRIGPTQRVMTSAAETLTTIRDARYAESLEGEPALEEMRTAARELDTDRSLASQQHRVQQFFLSAGAVLSAMARPGDPGTEPPA